MKHTIDTAEDKELTNAWRRFERRWETLVDRANDFSDAITPLEAQVALVVEIDGQFWLFSTSGAENHFVDVVGIGLFRLLAVKLTD